MQKNGYGAGQSRNIRRALKIGIFCDGRLSWVYG